MEAAVENSVEGSDTPLEGMKSTAFVVHFDPPAASKPLKFTRHTRNLSLPLAGSYPSKVCKKKGEIFVVAICSLLVSAFLKSSYS